MSSLVDALGMVAGAIWMCAAIYFQLIREGDVHPAYVMALFCIGTALMMLSAAVALPNRTMTVEILAVVAHLIFIVLGLGAWYTLERYADRRDRHPDGHSYGATD